MVLAGWLHSLSCVYLCVGWRSPPRWGAPLYIWSPLDVAFPPLELVLPPLECELLVVPLSLHKLCCAWSWHLLAHFFAIAILKNSLLTFCNASVVLFPVGMFPFSAIVSCCAAVITLDSSETVGFVMYWCLKNTVSLICVAFVLVMYTLMHW